jgi:trigger factor
MNVEKVYNNGLEYKFLVKISKDKIDQKVEDFLREKAKTYKKHGFRPGKVPTTVLKKDLGQDAYSDFLYDEIRNGYTLALKNHDIKPIRDPEVKKIDDIEGHYQYEIIVEKMPAFELQDFSKITLKKLQAKLPDDQINGFIQKLQKIHGQYAEIEGESKEGNFVTVHYTVSDDGKEIEKFKDVEDILEIDLKSAKNKDLIEKLIGIKKGDTFTLTQKGDIFQETLSGKEVSVAYTINKIESCTPCELNEDFYKKLESSNLDELKKKLSGVLSVSTDRMTNMYLKRQLLDALNDSYNFEIPRGMIEDEKRAIERKIADEEKNSGELDEKVTPEELEILAKRRVRLGILIGKISEDHKISVSKKMLLEAMYQSAQNSGQDPEKIVKQWLRDQHIISFFKMQLLEMMVIDFLLNKVTIEEKEVTAQELYKEVEDVIPDEVYDVEQ